MSHNAKKVNPFPLAFGVLSSALMSVTFAMVMPSAVFATPSSEVSEKLAALKTSEQPWLEVDLSEQELTLWQGGETQYTTIVSTGKADTPTETGIFTIQRKLLEDRMRGDDYDLSHVPHVMYYHRGYAIHGAYWHNQFGTPVSHGCVNLPLPAAKEIYESIPIGSPVVIHD